MPRLKLISENHRGRVIELDGPSLDCGRSASRTICIQDKTISSYHCDFVLNEEGRYVLMDRGSTNGSRVNHEPITEQVLYHSDLIQLGSV